MYVQCDFPYDAEYVLRVRAYGQQAGPDPVRMALLIDDKEIQRFDVTAEEDRPLIYGARVSLKAGRKKLSAAYLNNYVNPKDPNPRNRDRNLIVDYLEVIVPAATEPSPLPVSHQHFCWSATPRKGTRMRAKNLATSPASLSPSRSGRQVERLAALAEWFPGRSRLRARDSSSAASLLISPHFLFRGELQSEPNNPQSIHRINEDALASGSLTFCGAACRMTSSLPRPNAERCAES